MEIKNENQQGLIKKAVEKAVQDERIDICNLLDERIRTWKSEILIGGDEVVAEHYIRAYELIKGYLEGKTSGESKNEN